MKIQITENDIRSMVKKAIKKLNETHLKYGQGVDVDITTSIVFNPNTKKYVFYEYSDSMGDEWWNEISSFLTQNAKKLSDGPIYNCMFDADDFDFAADDYSNEAELISLKFKECDFWGKLQNGQFEQSDGTYGDTELSEEDKAFVTQIANENIDSFHSEITNVEAQPEDEYEDEIDDDYGYDPLYEGTFSRGYEPKVKTRMYYNPLTKKFIFIENKFDWEQIKNIIRSKANELGDGPIFEVTFELYAYERTRQGLKATSVEVSGKDFAGELQNGQFEEMGDQYEDVDFTEDDEYYINDILDDCLDEIKIQ